MKNWIDKTMNSLEGMEKAQPSPDLFARIQKNLPQEAEMEAPKQSWLSIAAVILVVICSNAFFITNYYNQDAAPQEVSSYDQIISDFNIYEL